MSTIGSLARKGRFGDTELAHVNPAEKRMLRAAGGSGTRNPKTGLPEFFGGFSDARQSAGLDHPGNSNSGNGGTHGSGNVNPSVRNQTTGQQQTAANATASSSSGAFSGQGGSGPMSGSGNATVADRSTIDAYKADPAEKIATDRDYWNAVSNLGQRANDFANRGNSTADDVGNFLAGLASIGELDPTKQSLGAAIDNPNASWGVDPLGLATTIGGMVTGLPINTVYSGIKKATGYTGPMIAFDGNQYGNYGFNSSPIDQGLGVVSDEDFDNAASGSLGSLAAGRSPAHLGKSDGSGSLGSLGPVAATAVPVTPAARTPDSTEPDGTDTPDPTVDPTVHPYPGDPLHYGEVAGGWNFWPDGHPVVAANGGPISGPGDGQSDDIPALLSNGEHVIDAQTVSALGRGSNEAGHRAIEQWKQSVRKKAGYRNPKKAPLMGSIGSLARAA